MKHTLTIFFIAFSLLSCSKKTDTPVSPVVDTEPAGTVIATGSFTSGVHTTSGTAKIFDDKGTKKLRLENFKTDSGPDLKVYLSKDKNATGFINISKLRSATGNQNYDITGMPDFVQYKYVLIWCEQFGVLFGSAQIQ
ncbi:MAG: DM13 domain-containing protein [Chitinophagaceae bacterium]